MIQSPIQNTAAKALIHHIIQYYNNESSNITLTQLYQLLYLIDFGHYALHNKAITNLNYLKYNISLIAIGADDCIKLIPQQENTILEVKEPLTIYHTLNTNQTSGDFVDTALDIIQKTLHFCSHHSTEHIAKIIAYHPSWVLTRSGHILPYHLASHCDFEWLGYYANGKTEEDVEELKKERFALESNDTIKSLMTRIQKIKRAA